MKDKECGIYKSLGILQTGQLVETDRSGLVAEAQPDRLQSAKNITKEVLSEFTKEDLLRADKAAKTL